MTPRFASRTSHQAAIVVALLLTSLSAGAEVTLGVSMGNTCVMAGQRQKGYLRIALTGQAPEGTKKRAPGNVALVLDRSGSMAGEKLTRAKEAVIGALDRLAPDDIVSIIAYDTRVDVLFPAAKASNHAAMAAAVVGLTPGNTTALYDGVLAGAGEIRKFKEGGRVNRIVLLSDGLANAGPQSPAELATLGASLRKEDISVTTIGLGLDFNEDLMTQLAAKSDGNHLFAETAGDAIKAFSDEFTDVLSVVAKNVGITVALDPRIHPIRAMGREATIAAQGVYAGLVQLYSGQTKYLLLEVAIDPISPKESFQAASAQIEYLDGTTGAIERRTTSTLLRVSDSPAEVLASENKDVMECVVAQVATESNQDAVRLRDQGRVEQSKQLLQNNAQWLQQNAVKYNSPTLDKLGKANQEQSSKISDVEAWKGLRKSMGKGQYDIKQQTSK